MTQEAGHSFFIYVCEQEVIATSMDHNITGQGDLNRDHPNQEDITREKNISEVPGSNENEAVSGKSTDREFVQGSLDPQDPTAEKPYQGSLDPQEPSSEDAYQGSLDPQGASAGTRKQGSLNPQKAVQGSLDPQSAPDRKNVQGSLASPGMGRRTTGEAAPSGPAAGKAASSGAGAGAQSESSVSAASDSAKSAVKAAEQGAAPAGIGDGAAGDIGSGHNAVPAEVPGGISGDAVTGAPKTAAAAASSSSDSASEAGGKESSADAGAAAASAAAAASSSSDSASEAGGKESSAGAGAAVASAAAAAATAAVSTAEAGGKGSSAGAGTAVTYAPVMAEVVDAEEQKKKNKEKKSHRKAIAFWISFLLILSLLSGVYYGGYKYCETHFMPGSTINGFDCSGLTEEEAEKRFADAADKYTLNIRFRGGSTEVLTAQDIGFAYKPDGSIGAMIYGQDRTLWPRYLFEDYAYTLELGGSCDPDLLTSALSALPELQEENMQKPQDAYIQFMDGNETEDGSFQVIPDNPGNTIDLVQLAAGAGDAAARYEQDIDAEKIAGAYKEAEKKADDPELVARCKDLNDIVGASITYVLPDHTELKLNSDVMKDWLVRDEKGRLVKDDEVWDEQIWKFMELLAYNSNTIGTDREFNSTARGTITVTGGDYGYMVNQIAEHDLLVKDLAEGKVETRKPSYYISAYNDETENDGIGKTYMEVDLTAQHMWCYIDGKMVLESDCVTGDPTNKHETPTGVFGIMFMKKDATLRGIQQKNGKYEYETKVKYWMPFYDDCGFHDAWWRTAFGGEIYKGDGSHGCVNLPSEAAEKLFSYCEDKMPVVIYK